jgi:hypothetical protein
LQTRPEGHSDDAVQVTTTSSGTAESDVQPDARIVTTTAEARTRIDSP